MKTLLQIIQNFCERTGVSKPLAVMSNTDDMIVQQRALLNEGLEDLAAKYKWPQLRVTASFTTLATDLQGEIETIAPGFKSLIKDTFWNTTRQQRMVGSIDGVEAAQNIVLGSGRLGLRYRLVGGEIRFHPPGPAGETCTFEYLTQYIVRDGDTDELKPAFTKDTDYIILPDNLLIMDLRWRWKAEKGLAYAENFRTFETNCKQAYVDSLDAVPLNMSGACKNARPGIIIPEGNWNI